MASAAGILALLLFASLGLVKGLEGQCGLPQNCCVGRDSSCVIHGLQPDGKMVRNPCYCDEGCLETNDCCSDYNSVCNVERKFFKVLFMSLTCMPNGQRVEIRSRCHRARRYLKGPFDSFIILLRLKGTRLMHFFALRLLFHESFTLWLDNRSLYKSS